MRYLLILVILSFGAGSLGLSATLASQQKKPAAKPNFSGTWKVNIEKSTFDPSPTPKSLTYKIEHQELALKLTSTRVDDEAEDTVVLKLTTDGQETMNVVRGIDVKSKITWEGDVLVIQSVSTVEGANYELKDRWSISEDGKTITWLRHYLSAQGEADAKYILEKQ
jgi:hypothetical protein